MCILLPGAAGCGGQGDSGPVAPSVAADEVLEGEPLELVAADGQALGWPRGADAKPLVLIFINRTCPIANGYAPEIKRIVEHYAPRGIEFWLVYPEPGVTPTQARAHASEFGYASAILADPSQQFTGTVGATMTPESLLVMPGGRVAYRGRIDDLYADLGVRRPAARETELRDALDAVLAGEPIAVARTEAVGCIIEAPLPGVDPQ